MSATAPDHATRGDPKESRGFVFATTGADYTTLARRAARTLRLAMPKAEIDLFTDQAVEDPIFDRIHALGDGFFRPKMEATRRTRFDRTVFLDADILVLTDVSELFDLLDNFEIAGAHGVNRRKPMGYGDPDIPRAFPVINSGVLAVRKTPRTQEFLARWEREVRESEARLDQPTLRRLLWSGEIAFTALPYEYNIKHPPYIRLLGGLRAGPRIIHEATLHKRPPGDPTKPLTVREALGSKLSDLVHKQLQEDPFVNGNFDTTVCEPPEDQPEPPPVPKRTPPDTLQRRAKRWARKSAGRLLGRR
ncbi:putative nucleotide-diphospho-sugar transferase [Histidinibacterium aquaticum]|uniref:Nucleotide-diphospho-sugar transferase domain-containing protein n=1 Tax=Histidinibacterium aquaticum TaxID=2613962 RepID=A0A5J5GAE4_9RHOB|nr:putative nucleotide-diphospho-sugar transferase [Histidinibacterium aquaticum]KAA9005087.1 hypothetical protein F3S47_18840 [Histidinibacterium aquaticum]